VELRLLGPVEIGTADQTLSLGAPQQRAILAALAVDAGRLVSREVLIDRVWGSSAPARVESGVYAYITRLRKILERARALDADRRATLEREPGGYRLSLPPDGLDLHRFRRLVTTARGRDLADAERAGLLTQALAQWRGTALTGVRGEWAGRMRDGLSQERLHATVAWAQARMMLGKPETTFGPLSDLAAEFPLAEPVAAELLRALAATGRGADALDRYGKLRRRLVEELGAEPGPELQAVHEELLRGERPG
jgi:DNA-binding SARP family transcriptional activator